jgi:hypothetical protein
MAYPNRYQAPNPPSPANAYSPNSYASPLSPSTPRLDHDPFATAAPSYQAPLTGRAHTPTYAPAYRAHSPTSNHPLSPDPNMAYNQRAQQPYQQPYQQPQYQQPAYNSNAARSTDDHSDWDGRSTKSYQTYHSQTHLDPYNNKQYEMSQIPSVPTLQYNPAGGVVDYPPQQQYQTGLGGGLRPGMGGSQHSTTGYSSAREKMMKRRVSPPVYCLAKSC